LELSEIGNDHGEKLKDDRSTDIRHNARAKTESLSTPSCEHIDEAKERPLAWAKKEAKASPFTPGVGIWTPTR